VRVRGLDHLVEPPKCNRPGQSSNVGWEILEKLAQKRYYDGMKFFAAIVAYLVIGLILGMGIYEAVEGHLWFLAAGVIVYVMAFAKLGCLPSSKSH
jgi:hypothetical protein